MISVGYQSPRKKAWVPEAEITGKVDVDTAVQESISVMIIESYVYDHQRVPTMKSDSTSWCEPAADSPSA